MNILQIDSMDTIPEHEQSTHYLWPRTGDESIVNLFNYEDEPVGTFAEISGVTKYTPRLGGALSKGDAIVVVDNLRQIVTDNRDYLVELGVQSKDSKSEIIGVPLNGDKSLAQALLRGIKQDSLEGTPQAIETLRKIKLILPFIQSDDITRFSDNASKVLSKEKKIICEGNGNGAELLNHKGYTMDALKEMKVRVPNGKTIYSIEEGIRFFKQLASQKKNLKVVIKEARSASGCGSYEAQSTSEIYDILHKLPAEILWQGIRIEEWIENIVSSPGVVIHTSLQEDGSVKVTFVCASEQLLEGKVHLGNIWPIRTWGKEMEEAVIKYAELAASVGMYGNMGLDFVIAKENSNLVPYAIDPNGRMTGQLHTGLIIHNIYGTSRPDNFAWLSDNNFPVPKNISIQDLALHFGKHQFSKDTGGVILANHATASSGKVQVIFVAPVNPKWSAEDKHRAVKALRNEVRF